MEFHTERVPPNTEFEGQAAYWIAYPAHVARFGRVANRIEFSWGTGDTKAAALAAANAKGGEGGYPVGDESSVPLIKAADAAGVTCAKHGRAHVRETGRLGAQGQSEAWLWCDDASHDDKWLAYYRVPRLA